MADSKTCPPLGSGSVDFETVQKAAAKGGDIEAAIVKATTRPEPVDAGPAYDVPAGYVLNDVGNGWHEIVGPDGFEPVKARGDDDIRTKLAALPAPGADAPATPATKSA